MRIGINIGIPGLLRRIGAGAAAVTDAFFEYVTLLLHGDGTNGAQNNTFLDGSTNNFTITRNGNTTQGSFSPFSQTGWSNYFDGTGDYLTAASNAAFDIEGGAYTIEGWFYFNSLPAGTRFFVFEGTTQTRGLIVSTTTTNLEINHFGTGAVLTATNAAVGIVSSWAHVCVVSNGTNRSIFVNGTRFATATSALFQNTNNAVGIAGIGGTYAGSNPNAYISNFRVVKGSAVYDPTLTTLTVPTAPLTAITNTSLLTCQSNRFRDNSSNAFAITRNGDVRVEAFSPFNPSTVYSTANVGGSGYFDGTGDYLSVARNNAFLPVANEDFTFEAWVYLTATPGATGSTIMAMGEWGSSSDWFFYIDSSRQAILYQASTVTSFTNTTTLVPLNAWTHIAAARSGTGTNNLTVYVNGSGQSGTTNATMVGAGLFNLSVGADQNGDESNFTGYISNFRLVKGTAVYTANFTPPTAPLTAITNTSLLCNFTNGGIFDNASQTVLETVGNAQVSTTQKKFGTGSMYFDGTGDWLFGIDKPTYRFGTGDFTVEFWVYFNSTSGLAPIIANGLGLSGSGTIYEVNWSIYLDSSNLKLTKFVNPTQTDYTFAWTPSTGQWYHVAVARSGTSLRAFVNGSQIGTTQTSSLSFSGATNNPGLSIGRLRSGVSGATIYELNGYIDDLRITNGYARYTANFTAPTAAFPDN